MNSLAGFSSLASPFSSLEAMQIVGAGGFCFIFSIFSTSPAHARMKNRGEKSRARICRKIKQMKKMKQKLLFSTAGGFLHHSMVKQMKQMEDISWD